MELKGADWILSLGKFGQKPGLSRISYMLEKLDNPQDKLKFIHVAGTNGKGSTSAYLAEILKRAGYKVGLFTSPFMETFNERFKVNDEMISDDELEELVEKVKVFASDENLLDTHGHPTQFEIVTVIAMLYFHRKNVDMVVLEVGLGGRLDATNVIKTPLVSVITNIALEHTDVLGETLEEIAAEKAGIIKEKVPVITGVEQKDPSRVVEEVAGSKGAPFYKLHKDFNFFFKSSDFKGQKFDYAGMSKNRLKDLEISLLGEHQLKNASLALAIVEKLKEMGLEVGAKEISKGLKFTKWPGRMEIFQEDPLILLDASHNLEGIKCLCKELRKHFLKEKDIILLMGVLADKKVDKMMAEILPQVSEVIFTTPENPRSMPCEETALIARKYLDEECIYIQNEIESATELAIRRLKNFDKENGRSKEKALVCCGSFFVVSPVRNYLLEFFARNR